MKKKQENNSGWFPLLHKIIVLTEEAEYQKKVAAYKKAGIILPEDSAAREEHAQFTGVVIACGPEVFSDQQNSTAPEPGDTVIFAQNTGHFFKGTDGVKYRMISDLDLSAIKGKENE